jgi:hypothetical protein
MILCPIALAVGCRKCPVFSICPVKTIIGDQAKASEPPDETVSADDKKPGPRAAKNRGGRKAR